MPPGGRARLIAVRLDPDLDRAVRQAARAQHLGLSNYLRGVLAGAVHTADLDPCGCTPTRATMTGNDWE